MAGQSKVEGVVLRRRPLGEADDIVTLLSPTRGRFDAVARGIRKSKRSSSGRLEPFMHVQLLLSNGRSLDVVGQVQVQKARPLLMTDLDRLAGGIYLLELYDRITEAEAGERIFRTLVRALDELEAGDVDLACRRAELRLLTILGCAPRLETCVQCDRADDLTGFSVTSGGALCAICRPQHERVRWLSAGGRALLLSLRSPGLLEATRWWSDFPNGIRAEVEGVLAAHLDWHWPSRVRSRRFLGDVRALGEGACSATVGEVDARRAEAG